MDGEGYAVVRKLRQASRALLLDGSVRLMVGSSSKKVAL